MPEQPPKALDDDVLALLAELPEYDVDSVQAARMRRIARAHLPSPEPASRPRLDWLARLYTRALEPAWVAGVAVVSLLWALRAVLAIGP